MQAVAGLIQQVAGQQNETTPPESTFAWTQVIAALIVVGLVFLASNLYRLRTQPEVPKPLRRGGLFTGWDRRLSTSKTIALAWTMLVAYMIVTLALLATSSKRGAGFFTDVFQDSDVNTNNPSGSLELYLVLLGGPYAAVVLAKVSVVSKLEKQDLQKTDAPGPNPADLVGNDNGTANLPDFQYVLFNLIGLLAVLALFWTRPGGGLPGIPSFLAILLGGSALTYTVSKASERNKPVITGVHPTQARVGEIISVVGDNLYLPATDDAKTRVSIGGVEATEVGRPAKLVEQGDRVEFKVPPPKTGAWTADEQKVVLTTTAAATVEAPEGLTIVEDRPSLDKVTLQPALGEQLTLTGRYFYAAGDTDQSGKPTSTAASPIVKLAWTDRAGNPNERELALDKEPAPSDSRLAVTMPPDLVDWQTLPLDGQLSVRRADGSKLVTGPVKVGKPAAGPSIDTVSPPTARVGQLVTVVGSNLDPDSSGANVTVAVDGASPQDVDAAPDGKQATFKVPAAPDPPGSWPSAAQDLTVTAPNKLFTVRRGLLTIEADKVQLHPLSGNQPVSQGKQLTLTGRHFYQAGDLDATGKPTTDATDPVVRLSWTDKAGADQSKTLTLVKSPVQAAPTDTQLTVDVQDDLVDPNDPTALPLTGKLQVDRAGTPSNAIDVTVAV